MYFLFSDDEYFHQELEAKTWRAALAEVRDWFRIKGRLRIVDVKSVSGTEIRTYRLDDSANYKFTLKQVDQ